MRPELQHYRNKAEHSREVVHLLVTQRQSVDKEHEMVKAERNAEFDVGLRRKVPQSGEAVDSEVVAIALFVQMTTIKPRKCSTACPPSPQTRAPAECR